EISRVAENGEENNRFAKHTAEDRYQTGHRSHGIERCSVGLDKKRISVNSQQTWQGKHVGGGLEHPTRRAPPNLQMLKETAVIFVCRSHILAKEPGPIRRD